MVPAARDPEEEVIRRQVNVDVSHGKGVQGGQRKEQVAEEEEESDHRCQASQVFDVPLNVKEEAGRAVLCFLDED